MSFIVEYMIAVLLSFVILAVCILILFFIKNDKIKNMIAIICVALVIIIALYCYFEIRIPFLRTMIK